MISVRSFLGTKNKESANELPISLDQIINQVPGIEVYHSGAHFLGISKTDFQANGIVYAQVSGCAHTY